MPVEDWRAMPDDARDHERDEEPGHAPDGDVREESGRLLDVYGRGVRTALRDNASAYGFSISVTAAYGLVSASRGPGDAVETISFALGAGLAFVLVSLVFLGRFQRRLLSEGEQVLTLSGGFDFLSVTATVAVAFGLSRIPGYAAWPLTGLGTVVTYLLIGGLDVILARALARRTSAGRPG